MIRHVTLGYFIFDELLSVHLSIVLSACSLSGARVLRQMAEFIIKQFPPSSSLSR